MTRRKFHTGGIVAPENRPLVGIRADEVPVRLLPAAVATKSPGANIRVDVTVSDNFTEKAAGIHDRVAAAMGVPRRLLGKDKT